MNYVFLNWTRNPVVYFVFCRFVVCEKYGLIFIAYRNIKKYFLIILPFLFNCHVSFILMLFNTDKDNLNDKGIQVQIK